MIGQTCGLYRREETKCCGNRQETDLLEDEIEGEKIILMQIIYVSIKINSVLVKCTLEVL
jgi:hypothetical protein